MDAKARFIGDYLRQVFSFSELCARYGISRKTGYKWIGRYQQEGPAGLYERVRAPKSCPHQTDREVSEALLAVRARHPSWGAKKLLAYLAPRRPELSLPARSTVCALLKRAGVVDSPRRSRKRPHPGKPVVAMDAPNDTWCVDFKGEFKTLDGIYCYPLTVTDGASRFLLGCRGMLGTRYYDTRRTFERLFARYGLPERIRSDNGTPFASSALARLSKLSVWWIRLGVTPELIEPGRPDQNGRHERMHRTLKHESTRPPKANLKAQQRRFDRFRREYNHERPHEALDQQTPASRYRHSPRPLPRKLPPIEYPAHFEIRRVSRNGGIRWHSRWVNVSETLAEEFIAFEEIDDGLWQVYFGKMKLGRFHERLMKIEDERGRLARKKVSPMLQD